MKTVGDKCVACDMAAAIAKKSATPPSFRDAFAVGYAIRALEESDSCSARFCREHQTAIDAWTRDFGLVKEVAPSGPRATKGGAA